MTARPTLFSRLIGFVTDVFAPRPLPSADTVQRQLAALSAQFDTNVTRLAQGLKNGTVTLGQFDGAMRSAIRQHHLAAAVVAEGGTANATPQTLALAQQQVNAQLAYFDNWISELRQQAAAGKLPSAEYLAHRARLYGKAAGETASRAGIQAQGLPMLPFYPKQATKCRVGCKCRWDVRVVDAVNGSYDCYWVRSADESCRTCLARSRAANPLRVRRGEIVNPEKYRADHLYG